MKIFVQHLYRKTASFCGIFAVQKFLQNFVKNENVVQMLYKRCTKMGKIGILLVTLSLFYQYYFYVKKYIVYIKYIINIAKNF